MLKRDDMKTSYTPRTWKVGTIMVPHVHLVMDKTSTQMMCKPKFACHYERGLMWFRIFGRGLLIKNVNTNPLLFSERYGYRKSIRIGNVLIRALK